MAPTSVLNSQWVKSKDRLSKQKDMLARGMSFSYKLSHAIIDAI